MKWRMCTRQPDAVVSDEHRGRCAGQGNTPEAEREDEVNYYGGHFICESVNPRFRSLILAAPALLAALQEVHVDGSCPRCQPDSGECPLLAAASPPQPEEPGR